eukprot:c399_g1_i1.p1 GENE.c399_g1_i1~~c399_g1_i1.p1  ORF type:complete len:353 (-),score=28.54 c399_g1_i1:101-1159(-)
MSRPSPVFRSPVWAETLGDHPDVCNHDMYVGMRNPENMASLPPQILLGSFRGQIKNGLEVQNLNDFSLIFHNYKVVGKGVHLSKQFLINGKFNSSGDGDSGRIRFAATQRNFRLPDAFNSESTTSKVFPFAGVVELRCEFVDDLTDLHNVPRGMGFIGDWFSTDSPDLASLEDEEFQQAGITSGKVVLWPTPSEERTGGYLSFTFTGPTCGLEHSGSSLQWHGPGAEVKRVHEPAVTLGMRSGDMIKFINNIPVTGNKTSSDISALIKGSDRPLTILVWRDVIKTNFKSLNLVEVESGPEPSSMTWRLMKTFNSMENLSADLRKDMIGELSKKRQNLDSIKNRKSDEPSTPT